jgi:cytosine/adenosine deaminase-related metal-dependent hydrolase
LFLDEMVRQGTTTVAAYCSVHRESAEAFFAEAAERNMLVIAGKVMMDRNAPEGVRDTPQSGYDDSKALISAWHGKGRALYAITPRFAITSSPEQMQMAGTLLAEHPVAGPLAGVNSPAICSRLDWPVCDRAPCRPQKKAPAAMIQDARASFNQK